MKLDAWLVTDVGMVRDHNEDSAFMESLAGVFIVADGMGGHAAGEVASAMAVDTVKQTLAGSKTEIETFKKGPTDAGRRAIVQLLQRSPGNYGGLSLLAREELVPLPPLR